MAIAEHTRVDILARMNLPGPGRITESVVSVVSSMQARLNSRAKTAVNEASLAVPSPFSAKSPIFVGGISGNLAGWLV